MGDTESLSSVTTVTQIDSSRYASLASEKDRIKQLPPQAKTVIHETSTTRSSEKGLTPREQAIKSDSLKRKGSTKISTLRNLELKESDIVYHKYLRAKLLKVSLEHANRKRQSSAFAQLYTLAEENNRIQSEITEIKISSERNEFNDKINRFVASLNEKLDTLRAILKHFLPVFVNFALALDATRHRFYLEDIKTTTNEDFKVSIDYCNELSDVFSTQINVIEEVLNTQDVKSTEKIEELCDSFEQFSQISEEIERNIEKCGKRCEKFYSLLNKSAAADTPGILNSVNIVDNLDLSLFKF